MPLTLAQLQAYSRGEVTRRELAAELEEGLSFGALLMQLHEHGLPLPYTQSDPNSPGVRLIAELAGRGRRDR